MSHIYIYVHGKSVTNKTSRENNNGTNASREREISRRSTLWQALSRRSKVEDQKKFDKQMTQPFFWGLHHHFVGRQSRQFCKKKIKSLSLASNNYIHQQERQTIDEIGKIGKCRYMAKQSGEGMWGMRPSFLLCFSHLEIVHPLLPPQNRKSKN